MRKKKIANYNANPGFMDYLTALRKMFTNDTDIIPVIMEFNFYINGVYGITYLDLFRMYDENAEDIHGTEKTKKLTDDGTIGLINEQIYKIGNGSLISSLEALRILLLDKTKKYTVVYNPFINAYAEALIPIIKNLGNDFPVVTTDGIAIDEAPIVIDQMEVVRNVRPQPGSESIISNEMVGIKPKKKKKSIWSYLTWAVYKPKIK